MPIRTSSGKWKWGNVERSSKKELVQTVYGIWKKNGSKGSFSDFLKGTHESLEEQKERYFVTDLDYSKHIKPVLDIFKTWPHVDVGNITKHDKDVKLKWFGLYAGHKPEDIVALVAIQTNFDDYTINIANVCSNGHGNGKKLLDKIIDYYSKTDRKYLVWFADPNGGEKLKNYYRTNFPDAEETEEKNKWWQTSKFTLKLKESVEPKDKFFKVKKNGKEIGKYGLSFYDDIKAVGIGDLEVYPEFRNKGYGTKIIKDIVNRYKNDYDKIYCFVDKDNKDAIRLYKRLGKVSDEVTYSQKISDYEYKNTNGQHYVEFYNKLKESMNSKRYAYHCTDVDPEIIRKEGWKVGDGFTLDNQFKDLYKKYLPKVPVFVSSLDVPVWDSKAKYCIKLDITGLELFPDFGYLPDFGAYYDYDEECFYWENEDDLNSNKKLKDFVFSNCDNLTLYADNFDGEDSFNLLGTACVDGTKLKDRIVEYVSMRTEKRVKSESYEPLYTLDTIKQKYGDEVYRKLRDDPVHKWRAETGIELIHHEPTKAEFERIVKNWDLMSDEDKKKSDEKSVEIFGRDNKDRIELLRKEYDFKVGDRVTIRKGLRCRQSGHSGKIIRVNLPEDHDYDSHGFSSFTIEMDDPNLGITSFQSGAIEKEMKKESVNEAHQLHSYPSSMDAIIEKITGGIDSAYELDHVYFNKEGRFFWLRNSKGYFHIFKPVKLKNVNWKPFALKDMILQDDGMLKQQDLIQFESGEKAVEFLKRKYNLNK